MVYGSYRSRNNPVEQTTVTCISLVTQHFNQDSTTRTTRTGRETMVHDEYSSFSKREKGIALYIYSAFRSPIIQSAKHGKYFSISIHDNPAALYIRP